MLALTLSFDGFRVMTSDQVGHAFELIERFPFLAAITDFRMLLTSGFDIVQKARVIRPEMHFIVGSCCFTPDNEHECRKALITHLLVKPYNVQEVSLLLHSLLPHAGSVSLCCD